MSKWLVWLCKQW